MEPCTLQVRNAASLTFDMQANHLMLRAPETCKGLAACSVLSVYYFLQRLGLGRGVRHLAQVFWQLGPHREPR